MAENNRDTESFALGLIVAAILYLLLRRELGKSSLSNAVRTITGAGTGKTSGGCGCGSASTSQANSNVPIPIGGQSYNQPYPASTVAPREYGPIVEFAFGGGNTGASEQVN